MPTRPIWRFAGAQRRGRAHRSSGCSPARRKSRRRSIGWRRRRASGARGAEEIRLSPPLGGGAGIRLVPRPRAARAAPGRARRALWTVADVTRERERQENVFQELQHAIDYLDHAPAGFFSADPAGAIVYMNATLAAWLDYDLAQVGSGGLNLADIVPRNAAAMLTSVVGRARRACAPRPSISICAAATASSCRCGSSTASPSAMTARRAPRARWCSTARPAATSDEGQRAAEVRFARFFNNTPIAIATVNRAGAHRARQRRLRAAVRHAAAQRRRAARGRSILDAVAERDRDALEAGLDAAAEGQGDIPPLELHARRRERPLGALWVTPVERCRARTARRRSSTRSTPPSSARCEEQFAQAQKMQAVGQLAGGVAHDFNNVLQAIIGYSDLLLANHRPTDPSFQDIMQIKQNANRAAGLVRQLLAFSRRQTLRPQVLSLNDVLSDLSMLLKRLLGERVELDLSHGRDLWLVKADVNQFEQVVMNLAVNARDAMPDGGKVSIRTANVSAAEEAPASTCSGCPPADYVRGRGRDTGTGMPPDVLDKIFEPFFTTKEVGKGTGLGLSTVYRHRQADRAASSTVDSELGQGTTFRIFLPRHIPTAEEPSETAPEPEDARSRPPTSPAGARSCSSRTRRRCAPSPRARWRPAATRCSRRRPASRPSRSSQERQRASRSRRLRRRHARDGRADAVRRIAQAPSRPAVIFVSGYAEDAFGKNLPEGEDFGFLPKPFSLKQLVETVKQVIGV